MTRESEAWREVASELGIVVEAPYMFVAGERSYACIALVRDFGSERGTLIRPSFPVDAQFMDDADEAGFAYSHLEIADGDRESVIEVLSVWGYCGSGLRPEWLRDAPTDDVRPD